MDMNFLSIHTHILLFLISENKKKKKCFITQVSKETMIEKDMILHI